jgi:hypothetical protein
MQSYIFRKGAIDIIGNTRSIFSRRLDFNEVF